MNDGIEELKNKYRMEMKEYEDQIKEFRKSSPRVNHCDYLQYRLDMLNYYRGAYNALIELETLK